MTQWHPVTDLPTDDNGEVLLTTDGIRIAFAHWEVDEPIDGVRFWYEGTPSIDGCETHWAKLPDLPNVNTPTP